MFKSTVTLLVLVIYIERNEVMDNISYVWTTKKLAYYYNYLYFI